MIKSKKIRTNTTASLPNTRKGRLLVRIFLFTLFIINYQLSTIKAQSYKWQALGNGLLDEGFNCMVADTANDILYAAGQTIYSELKVEKWNGFKWDSLPIVKDSIGAIFTLGMYKGELYAGGSFVKIGGKIIKGLAKWDGTAWQKVADMEYYNTGTGQLDHSAVRGMLVNGNDLYVMGHFEFVNGTTANKIARFDGTNWYALPTFAPSGGGFCINTAAFYKGELYVGGNFVGPTGMQDIAKFDGTNWQSVGGGLSGANTGVNKLLVWHDTLFVAGLFKKTDGDFGNNIMAWDSTAWHDLDNGLLPSNVRDIIIYNNELWACGQISQTGNGATINGVAIWNGSTWRDWGHKMYFTNGSQAYGAISFTLLNNELYMGGGINNIDNVTVNNIAKYALFDGIKELEEDKIISIIPNPSNGSFKINLNNTIKKEATISVYDITGREIYNVTTKEKHNEINLGDASKGVYILKLQTEKETFYKKIVVN